MQATKITDNKHDKQWDFKIEDILPEDSLLACLMIMTKYHQNPFSEAALSAGLPLVNNHLTVELFDRAANRAGLKSQLRKRDLNDISSLMLPAILLLENQKASVLLEINSKQGEKGEIKTAKIIHPETGPGVLEIPIEELDQLYLGRLFFIRPEYDFATRGDEVFKPKAKHWFWSVFHKALPIYTEVIIASFLINLFALAVPLFIMNVYDRVVPNNAFETLWVLAIGVGIVFAFDFLLRTLRAYFIDSASKTTDIRLSSLLFSHVLGIKMSARPSSVGAFANSIQSFEFFRDFLASTTVTILVDIPFFFLYILIVYIIGGNIVFVPLILVPIILIVQLLLQAPVVKLTRKLYSCSAEKQATLYESLTNVETIKTEAAEGKLQRRWEGVIGVAAKVGAKLRFITNLGLHLSVLVQQMTSIIIVIVGVYKVANGSLTVGALIACVIISSRAMAPVTQFASILTRWFQAQNALNSINTIMKLPVDRPTDKKPLHRPKLEGSIIFNNVSFTYPNEEVSALKNISFNIKKGERVGFVGRIGSGKTTIAKLILGLYQQNDGTVLIDGTEVNQYDVGDLRRNIGYVPQDITLFYGSIKDNIIFGHPYVEDSAIIKAAKIAGVDQFTATHPQGLDRQVGENGKNLSGGQRQAINVARALLNDPPVLILDEPSNAMDDTSEKMLKQQIEKHLGDRTLLIVTHKASLLQLVDRLIILDQGAIVADGPKDKIVEALKTGKIKQAI